MIILAGKYILVKESEKELEKITIYLNDEEPKKINPRNKHQKPTKPFKSCLSRFSKLMDLELLRDGVSLL